MTHLSYSSIRCVQFNRIVRFGQIGRFYLSGRVTHGTPFVGLVFDLHSRRNAELIQIVTKDSGDNPAGIGRYAIRGCQKTELPLKSPIIVKQTRGTPPEARFFKAEFRQWVGSRMFARPPDDRGSTPKKIFTGQAEQMGCHCEPKLVRFQNEAANLGSSLLQD